MRLTHLLCATTVAATALGAETHMLHQFKKIQLTKEFWAEGASFGDFNKDGQMDVAYGPFWFQGPEFTQKHAFAPATESFKLKKPDGSEEQIPGFEGALGVNNAYSKNFLSFTCDVNGDGWTDILVLGFPGEDSNWYENPKGKEGMWTKHMAIPVTDNESPAFVDITGDGKPEIVCSSGGYFIYAQPDASDANKPWIIHRITPKGEWQRFTHGMGVGDVNNDGKPDLLEKDGWWEQPASLAGDPEWKFHAFKFSPGGGSQMYAYDVDGDGDNDVIASVAAHGYGLAWYENVKENGEITFKEHIFMNAEPKENKYGVKFSQLHSVDLIDMDGDGIKDIVTGKRFWAHGSHGDAEPNAAPVLYWFKLVRGTDHSVDFIPYLIDDNSGVGTQVMAQDINNSKLPSIVVGNKRGAFVFLHSAKAVSKEEWQKAQPQPYAAGK